MADAEVMTLHICHSWSLVLVNPTSMKDPAQCLPMSFDQSQPSIQERLFSKALPSSLEGTHDRFKIIDCLVMFPWKLRHMCSPEYDGRLSLLQRYCKSYCSACANSSGQVPRQHGTVTVTSNLVKQNRVCFVTILIYFIQIIS